LIRRSSVSISSGSPPRVQGAPRLVDLVQASRWINPAWAGITGGPGDAGVLRRITPRMCGERVISSGLVDFRAGSPPRGRGAPFPNWNDNRDIGRTFCRRAATGASTQPRPALPNTCRTQQDGLPTASVFADQRPTGCDQSCRLQNGRSPDVAVQVILPLARQQFPGGGPPLSDGRGARRRGSGRWWPCRPAASWLADPATYPTGYLGHPSGGPRPLSTPQADRHCHRVTPKREVHARYPPT
jgi:hypothetical protein